MNGQPLKCARELGYRLPAEFEPVEAVWVSKPHNEGTWPGCLEAAKHEHQSLCDVLRNVVCVHDVAELNAATEDSWIRDYGPLFVVNNDGCIACHDFRFNGWGEKYVAEQSYEHDDAIAKKIAEHLNVPCWSHQEIIEGGALDANGRGTLLAAEASFLDDNRNPGASRADIERAFRDALNVTTTIWLPGQVQGDDTDGHVDNVARFVGPNTVLAVRPQKSHPDAAQLELNWSILESARDQDGRSLLLLPMPAPEPIFYSYPTGRRPVPASYANFLVVNDVVVVPVFSQPADQKALAIIEQAFPGRRIVGLPSTSLVVGQGSFHCLTMQQPKSRLLPV